MSLRQRNDSAYWQASMTTLPRPLTALEAALIAFRAKRV